METTKKCFLCGRPMKQQEGLLYELCTNPECPRSQPLPEPNSATEGDKTDNKVAT